jgi:hypothetical protein
MDQIQAMARDPQHNPDPNANAARIVRAAHEAIDAASEAIDLATAWHEWSAHIQAVDERGMTLLRAAFEAGFEAGRR